MYIWNPGHEPRESVTGGPAEQRADQNHERDAIVAESDGLIQAMHRHRRVRVHLSVSRGERGFGGVHDLARGREFSHQSIQALAEELLLFHRRTASGSVGGSERAPSGEDGGGGTMAFISEIEIAGSTRMKRNISVRKR